MHWLCIAAIAAAIFHSPLPPNHKKDSESEESDEFSESND
jgi:hypothetical protein